MTETFKLKCTFTVEHTVYAENLMEAKGIVKGMAVVQLPGFKLERIEPMKLDILPRGDLPTMDKTKKVLTDANV